MTKRTSQLQGRENIAKVKEYLTQLNDQTLPRSEVVKPTFPSAIRRPLYTLPGMFDFDENEVEAERRFVEGD